MIQLRRASDAAEVVGDDGGRRFGPDGQPNRYAMGPAEQEESRTVYRCWDTTCPERGDLAVEVGPTGVGQKIPAGVLERARALRELEHDNFAPIQDVFVGWAPHPFRSTRWRNRVRRAFGEAGDRRAGSQERWLYRVSRWVDGEPLRQWSGSRRPADVFHLLGQVGEGLDALHTAGGHVGGPWVHGGVSPASILVHEGTAILIDSGGAGWVPPGRAAAGRVVPTGPSGTGSAGYVAPEVLKGAAAAPAADRYALGAVAYFLFTGQDPPSPASFAELHVGLKSAGVERQAAERVLEMLAEDPGSRPGSAAGWAHGEAGPAQPSSSTAYAEETSGRPPGVGTEEAPQPRPSLPERVRALALARLVRLRTWLGQDRRRWGLMAAPLLVLALLGTMLVRPDGEPAGPGSEENGGPGAGQTAAEPVSRSRCGTWRESAGAVTSYRACVEMGEEEVQGWLELRGVGVEPVIVEVLLYVVGESAPEQSRRCTVRASAPEERVCQVDLEPTAGVAYSTVGELPEEDAPPAVSPSV